MRTVLLFALVLLSHGGALAHSANDSGGGEASEATWTDQVNDVFVWPNTHGPVVGLPCPYTDFLSAALNEAGELRITTRDVSSRCPGEDPIFQTYTFVALFQGGGWDEITVVITRYLPTDDYRTLQTYTNYEPLNTVEIDSSPTIDGTGSAIIQPLLLYDATQAIQNGQFESRMDSCAAGRCLGSLGKAFADVMPDEGIIVRNP